MADDVFGIVGTTQSGSFHVERAVAQGGFSVVYRAQHGAFRAPVALKCLKVPGDLTVEERAAYLERFRSEAELSFRLSASLPEVVRPLHVDVLSTPDGSFVPFIALEWLEGGTLADLISRRRQEARGPLGAFKLVRMLAPVARALARAHRFPGPTGAALTIVHGDVKPQNLLVATIGGEEIVKILDLGIATAARAAERRAGVERAPVAGGLPWLTPRYAAPEQWDPERFGPPGPWTDVWGLAVTMVEALTGEPAFVGSREEMRTAAMHPKLRPTPRARGATVADGVEEAFRQAVAVDPQDRARHIEPFWAALEAALGMPPTFERADVRRDAALRRSGSSFGKPLPREDFEEGEDRSSVPHDAPARTSVPSEVPKSPAPSEPSSARIGITLPPANVAVSEVSLGEFAIPDLAPSSPPPPARDSGLPPVLGGLLGGSERNPDRARASTPPMVSVPVVAPDTDPLEQELVLVPSQRPSPPPEPLPEPRPGRLDLDLAVSPGSLRPSSPDSGRPSRTTGPISVRRPTPPASEPEPRPGLGLPVKVIAAGAIAAAVDVALGGGGVALGPIRLLWIGAGLVVLGTVLLFWRVVEAA